MSAVAAGIDRTPALTPREKEAIDAVVRCFRERFTGKLEIEFSEGTPILSRQVEVRRFGKRELRVAHT